MKGFKKLVSGVLASSMILSMGVVPSFAVTIATGIGGDGETIYEEFSDVLAVTVDTDASKKWDFVLDPQGLQQLENGEGMDLDELIAKGGGVIFSDGYVPHILSKSSVPVTVSVIAKGISLKAGAATDAAGVFVAKQADLATDVGTDSDAANDNNVFISIAASEADVVDADTPFYGTVNRAIEANTAGDATMQFVLPASDFEVVRTDVAGTPDYTYEIKDGEVGHGTQLKPSGKVNAAADWADFKADAAAEDKQTLSLDVQFEYLAATDAENTPATTPLNAKAFGLIAEAGKDIEIPMDSPVKSYGIAVDYTTPAAKELLDITLTASGDLLFPAPTASNANYTFTARNATFAFSPILAENVVLTPDTGTELGVKLPTGWATGGWSELSIAFTDAGGVKQVVYVKKADGLTATGALTARVENQLLTAAYIDASSVAGYYLGLKISGNDDVTFVAPDPADTRANYTVSALNNTGSVVGPLLNTNFQTFSLTGNDLSVKLPTSWVDGGWGDLIIEFEDADGNDVKVTVYKVGAMNLGGALTASYVVTPAA